MQITITDNYNEELGYSYSPVTVILECDEEDAEIRYSFDNVDPLRHGVRYRSPFIIRENINNETKLNAVAIKDNTVSEVFSKYYVMVDPLADSDSDGLTNFEEGIFTGQDSDEDGIPDYLDEDSNNDGIPDSVQLNIDADKDGIPDRIQIRDDKFRIVFDGSIVGRTKLVENYPYSLTIRCLSGKGVVDIRNNSLPLSHNSSYIVADGPELPVYMEANTEVTYILMVSQCRKEEDILLQYTAYDAEHEGLDSGTICSSSIVMETEDIPYAGIRISWSTVPDASAYLIRIGMEGMDSYIIEVPAADHTKVDTQWYIDREGTLDTVYSVAYRNKEGKTGSFSLPKHAPDIHEGKCLLQGNITTAGLEPKSNVAIAYRVVSVGKKNLIGDTVVVKSTHFAYTDTDGGFEIVVPQNSIIKIAIDEAGFDRNFAIPCSNSADLRYLNAMPNNNL